MFRFFERLVDPYTPYEETDTPPTRLAPFLWDYTRPFHRIFVVTAGLSTIVAFIEVGLIAYLGRLVDLLDKDPSTFWADHGVELVAMAVFFLTLRPVIQTAHTALLNQSIMPNLTALGRWRAHRQIMRQSIGWFENDFAGRIANRVMQTPNAVASVMNQFFEAVAFAAAYLIGAFILLADADLRLVLPLLGWFIPYLFLLRWVIRRIKPASQASSDARSVVTGRIVDGYTNIHAVKMFAHHDAELTYAKGAIEESRTTLMREMRLYTIMDLALVFLNGVLVVGVVGWALSLWLGGLASVGVVASAAALVLRLNGMSGWIMWAVSQLFQELGVVAEGLETIGQPVTLTDAPGAVPLQVTSGEIKVASLSHHYGKAKGGLDQISLSIPAGQKVGLVGASGAGKSTLIKLLLRFYDAEGGAIYIDGQDIGSVTQASLRQAIGMVQQDSALLHRSVRENILYGAPAASDAAMVAAAKQAQAHDFIKVLADAEGRSGYDVRVGERGVKLSGGQRQRIALARVILKDAPILLLDEATSALDSEVEAAIQDTLETLMQGKTVIAIAHRLSTIARMDRIVVMDDGRIVEDGTHDELLALNGRYARFWARQSGGFLGDDI
ncbi:ABC transporter ATP-binding protein [Loktanella salsilacus]|uniref:ABC transporter ATP-binding protein n=1 Tax=Loktanella salsilacus TaxID=195913 RepID=UPI003734C60A